MLRALRSRAALVANPAPRARGPLAAAPGGVEEREIFQLRTRRAAWRSDGGPFFLSARPCRCSDWRCCCCSCGRGMGRRGLKAGWPAAAARYEGWHRWRRQGPTSLLGCLPCLLEPGRAPWASPSAPATSRGRLTQLAAWAAFPPAAVFFFFCLLSAGRRSFLRCHERPVRWKLLSRSFVRQLVLAACTLAC